MKHNETRIAGEGVELALREWMPESEVRGVVVLAHGLGEHVGRYAHVAAALCEAGWVLTGADHRGHGRSGGLRGHVDGFTQYAADLDRVVARARVEWPDKPLVIYGHSMGGLVLLTYLLEGRGGELAGIIVSNPLFRLAFVPPKVKVAIGRLLSRVLPRLRLDSELDVTKISRDPAVVEAYKQDPYVHSYISTRWYTSSVSAREAAFAGIEQIRPPTLWILGAQDGICDPQATREAAARLPSTQSTLFEAAQGFHEPHNDPEQGELFAAMTEWLAKITA